MGMVEAFIASLSQPDPSLGSVLLHPSWGAAPVNVHLQGSFNTTCEQGSIYRLHSSLLTLVGSLRKRVKGED